MALTYSPKTAEGQKMPAFDLPSVLGGGRRLSSQSLEAAPAKLVMFICAHCPYVQAIEDRLIDLGRDMKGLPVVGICSNDAAEYPEDSPAALKKLYIEKNYSFEYLVDESQQVARAFGALCTPDFFVYNQDNVLTYRGRLDDSWQDASKVTKYELKQAMLATAKGQPVAKPIHPSMGCSIKWRTSL